MNGIDLVLADHAHVQSLFASYDERPEGSTIGLVIDALRAHDDAEHAALYPLAGEILGEPDQVLALSQAHSAVKKLIDLVVASEGPALTDRFAELRSLVEAHVADEEASLLPELGRLATPAQLEVLASAWERAKQRVG